MHHFISIILRIAYALAFGYILCFRTENILHYIPQLLGGLLMLECIAQLLELIYLKLKTVVNSGFFVVPTVIFLYGLFLIFFCSIEIDPNARVQEVFSPTAGISWLTLEMKIAGVCCIVFVIYEIILSFVFLKPLYRTKQFEIEKKKKMMAQKRQEEELKKQAYEEAMKLVEEQKENEGQNAEPTFEEEKEEEKGDY
ncbi:MAG: hypothetical protein HUJ97_09495 [Bacteroidales bacterium]|nr:hypothetical protein [Bacteroidales bacterium]